MNKRMTKVFSFAAIALLALGEGASFAYAVTEETTTSTSANEEVLKTQETDASIEEAAEASSDAVEEVTSSSKEATSTVEESTTESSTEASEEKESKKEKSKAPKAASDPVTFADPNLEAWIRKTLNSDPLNLGIADSAPVTEEHMEKLTELKRGAHDNDYSTISDLKGLEYAVNLETLDFQNGKQIENNAFTALPEFFKDLKKLKYLRFNYGVLSDINALKDHPALEVFSAERNELTSLEGLSGCKMLLEVNVEGTGTYKGYKNCGIQNFKGLEQSTKLKKISFKKNDDNDGPTRVSASSSEPSYTGNGLLSLEGLNCANTLETLDLQGHPGLANLNGLEGYVALKTLYVRGGDSYNGRSTEYDNTQWLREKEFDPAIHTASYRPRGLRGSDALSALSSCTSLTTVSITNNAIEDISPLAGKTSLKILNISRNLITTLSPLITTNKLVTLDASHNLLTNLSGLENTDTLETLGVNSQCAGIYSMKWGSSTTYYLNGLLTDISAVNPKSLTLFNAGNNKLKDISSLKGAANLVHLDLGYNYLSDTKGQLDGCVSLEKVYLSSNSYVNFKDVGLHDSKGTLKHLRMGEQKVLESIAGLKDYALLEIIILSNNKLTDGEMTEIPNSVVELDVSYNQLEQKAFVSFNSTLMSNLSKLYANANSISDITPLESFTGLHTVSMINQRLDVLKHGGTVESLDSPKIGHEVDALKTKLSTGLTFKKLGGAWGTATLNPVSGTNKYIVEDPDYEFENKTVSTSFDYTGNPIASYFYFSGTISYDANYGIKTTAEISLIPTDIDGNEITEIPQGGIIYWRAKAKGTEAQYLFKPEFGYNLQNTQHQILDPYVDVTDPKANEYVNGARVEMGGLHIPTPSGLWGDEELLHNRINKDNFVDITVVTKVNDNATVGDPVNMYFYFKGLNFPVAFDLKTVKVKAKVPEVINLSAPDRFDFGKTNEATKKAKVYKPDAKSYTTQEQTDGFNVRVTDTRQTSKRTDWEVVAKLSELTNSKATALKAGSVAPTLALKDISLYSVDVSGGSETKITPGATDKPSWNQNILLTAGGASMPLSNADSANGEGVWDYRVPFDKVELNVPSDVNGQAGYTFKGKLTWTLDDTL